MANVNHWLALSGVPGVGPKTFRRLIDEFGDPLAVMQAPADALAAIPRVDSGLAEAIRRAGEDTDRMDEALAALADEGVAVVTLDHPHYPANLRVADDAPPVLYVRGAFEEPDALAAAIVGSRSATAEAWALARALAMGLAERGVTIVSGLAAGVDTAAHQGALEANGRTIGVLGSGIRVVHPRANLPLADQMIEHGALCSELLPNTRPSAAHLMARDRIVSGLARATIVVQAGEDSGTMDTARRAKKQARLCMALDWPGSGPECAGNRALIAAGAEAIAHEGPWDLDALARRIRDAKVEPPDAGKPKQLGLFG